MADNEVYYPETIEDMPIPGTGDVAVPATNEGSNQYGVGVTGVKRPVSEPDKALPERIIAVETISSSLDTRTKRIKAEYTFSNLGAIKIGQFKSGISGEIAITPSGITAKNVNNETTFTIDGATGDATFKGTLQAGTVIAGAMNVGDPNVVIDGANGRIIINDGVSDRILIGYQLGGFA